MSIEGARGVLLNITGNSSLSLHEISAAASVIYEQADPDANIILGSVIDDSLDEEVFVTVIATGFNEITQSQEIKHVNSHTIEPKKRDASSSYSFNYAPHKSSHTVSEPKNVINAPSKASSAHTFVREVQQAPVRTATVAPREVAQPRVEQAAQSAFAQRPEVRHETRHEVRQETRQEIRPEIARQENREIREQVNAAHYQTPQQEERIVYTRPQQPQPHQQEQRPQESHIIPSPLAAPVEEEVNAPVQAAQVPEQLPSQQQQAQSGSNDIEVPAYLRKNDNNQQFNWNKFNKKMKKHKFQ